MTRLGPEAKPPWSEVPRSVKESVARAFGSPVARATRIYGGYPVIATVTGGGLPNGSEVTIEKRNTKPLS